MLDGLCLEPMRLDDLTEVLAIEHDSFASPWSRISFEAELKKGYAGLEVASLRRDGSDRAVLGFVCFWLVADEIQITNLAVHVGYRRRGLGCRLLLHALSLGYQAGARLAVLEVRQSNEPALALYERFGFTVVQERPRYYAESEEAALVLELRLDRSWYSRVVVVTQTRMGDRPLSVGQSAARLGGQGENVLNR